MNINENSDLISVIVPIYNVELYLSKCITSIISQTYFNLEIILVDDGSTDSCPIICDKFKKLDKRIKVLHKKNGGLSDARNKGIDIAIGKYIMFVDSDDYLDEKIVEFLYTSLINNKADIATCNIANYYWNKPVINDKNKNIELIMNNCDALEDLNYQNHTTTSACAKLYLKELFSNIRYPYGKICEDLGTTYLLFGKAKRVVFNSKRMYFYLQRNNSIINSNRIKFNKNRLDAIKFAQDIVEYTADNFPSIIDSSINRLFSEYIYIVDKIPNCKEYTGIKKEIFNNIKKYRKQVIKDANTIIFIKASAFVSFFGYSILVMFIRFYSFVGKILKK